MKCPNCGKEIANDSQFCEYCGVKISKPRNRKFPWLIFGVILCLSALCIGSFYVYDLHRQQVEKVVETTDAQEEIKRLVEEAFRAEEIRKEEQRKLEEERQHNETEKIEIRRKELQKKGFVDLGLPSGIWWKNTSEKDALTYNDAVTKYGNNIPTKEQWNELINYCNWIWIDEGQWFEQDGERYKLSGECWYKVIGKNGNHIKITADGYVDNESFICVGCGGIGGVCGYYLSRSVNNNSIWYCYFDNSGVGCVEWEDFFQRTYELSVCLVQKF